MRAEAHRGECSPPVRRFRSSHLGSILLMVAVVAAAACDNTTAPPQPTAVVVVSGDLQSGTVGQGLLEPLVVRVEDARGNGLAGFDVDWQVTSGEGVVTATTTPTGPDGRASVAWTLGTSAGTNTLMATLNGLGPAIFTAEARADAPATIAIRAGDGQTAVVGTAVPVPPAVHVVDQYDNPVPGAPVTCTVLSGGGILTSGATTTDAAGVATVAGWQLGTTAGTNELSCSSAGLPPVVLTATAVPGAPASLAVQAGGDQTAAAGTAVPVAPSVMVRDAHGNPVEGVAANFAVTAGGGSVSGAAVSTGEDGIAAVGSWVLGVVAGANSLSVTAPGLAPATVRATGVAGPPASVAVGAGDGQRAPVNTAVAVAPSVIVRDVHGNLVEGVTVTFAVTAGGGSTTGANPRTGADGRAAVGSWVLGTAAGANSLSATVSGLPPVTFQAEAFSGGLNLYVESVHLNQGTQDLEGNIGGIAQRAGLLRIVVRASESNAVTPDVRVRLYEGANLLREETLTRPGGVPVNVDLADLGQTWNLPLAAGEVVPGLGVQVLVDPQGTITETTTSDNAFPQQGGTSSLDVQTLYPFNIVFIPIEATVHSTIGSVNEGNTDVFLSATRRWIPSSTISPSLHAPFTTAEDLSTGAGWSTLISDIQAVRTAEGATDQYYHGIIGAFSGIAYGGLGYRPSSSSSTFRTALSYDRQPFAPATVAHEFGHNMGRLHAPCGNPGNPDSSYPHSDARIGPPGYDIDGDTLVAATNVRDYMSYCSPEWTSDYTYDAILAWRRTDPLASQASGMAALTGRTSGLLLWGRIHSEGVELNPAFALEAVPALPAESGPNVLRGLAMDGSEVFRISFDGVPVADGPDPAERHFSFFVPLTAAKMEAVAKIELVGPGGAAAVGSGAAPAQALVEQSGRQVRVEAAGRDRLRLRWDAGHFPMALVKDAATGQILALARGGDARLATGGLDPDRLEILVSDGARSRRAKPE